MCCKRAIKEHAFANEIPRRARPQTYFRRKCSTTCICCCDTCIQITWDLDKYLRVKAISHYQTKSNFIVITEVITVITKANTVGIRDIMHFLKYYVPSDLNLNLFGLFKISQSNVKNDCTKSYTLWVY